MLSRYAHPVVADLWSDEWTYSAWLRIETEVLRAQRTHWVRSRDGWPSPASMGGTRQLLWFLEQMHIDSEAASAIRRIEQTETKHDVAAFLSWVRIGAPAGHCLHYGLTSSDLVDTAQGMRFQRLAPLLDREITDLERALALRGKADLPLVGRTHGQAAEPTSMRARVAHWEETLRPVAAQLRHAVDLMRTAKLSGPVGTFAHNPPSIERDVAARFGLRAQGRGASQILPRSALAMWATSAAHVAAVCAKVATDLRLMNLMGQVSWAHSDGQVGSSAMAHKNNPIVAEQVCGLARLAQGYASMLQPLDLWLERDISHSCVERIAVPDLWHVLFHVLKQTTSMLTSMVLNAEALRVDLEENANSLWTHKQTLEFVCDGESIESARAMALEHDFESYDVAGDARWFTREYPREQEGS